VKYHSKGCNKGASISALLGSELNNTREAYRAATSPYTGKLSAQSNKRKVQLIYAVKRFQLLKKGCRPKANL
jgi:hypothetical protein